HHRGHARPERGLRCVQGQSSVAHRRTAGLRRSGRTVAQLRAARGLELPRRRRRLQAGGRLDDADGHPRRARHGELQIAAANRPREPVEAGARGAGTRGCHPARRQLAQSLASVLRGHLFRIDGEASKARNRETPSAAERDKAQQLFTEAVVAFREAASLRENWPDPFLGLARTFIYGLEDVDRGANALALAEKYGHHPGERETIQLADGYRANGEAL